MKSSLFSNWRTILPYTDLFNWEKEFASKTNLHLTKIRLILMGINLLYILMVVNNQTLVCYKILEFLSVQELAIVSMFIPHISTSSAFINKIINNSKLRLNHTRLIWCISNKTLFAEVQHLSPIVCTKKVCTLYFVDTNIHRVVFNPLYPIIALIHKTLKVLYFFDYKNSQILHHFPLFKCVDRSILKWSPNGCNLSVTIEDEILLFLFTPKHSTVNHFNTFKILPNNINNKDIQLEYNWTPDNEMYILINKNQFGIILNSLKLLRIANISYPKCEWFFMQFLNNKLYFAAKCECFNHSVIYEGDKKKINVPGHIQQLKATEDLLVFLFVGSNYQASLITIDANYCSDITKRKNYLTIGIYDSNENALRQINLR